MIDTSWGSIRILSIMILGSIWFFLIVQQIEENRNESGGMPTQLREQIGYWRNWVWLPSLDLRFGGLGR